MQCDSSRAVFVLLLYFLTNNTPFHLSSLSGQYTVWGQVLGGFEHVQAIKKGDGKKDGAVRQKPRGRISSRQCKNKSSGNNSYNGATRSHSASFPFSFPTVPSRPTVPWIAPFGNVPLLWIRWCWVLGHGSRSHQTHSHPW